MNTPQAALQGCAGGAHRKKFRSNFLSCSKRGPDASPVSLTPQNSCVNNKGQCFSLCLCCTEGLHHCRPDCCIVFCKLTDYLTSGFIGTCGPAEEGSLDGLQVAFEVLLVCFLFNINGYCFAHLFIKMYCRSEVICRLVDNFVGMLVNYSVGSSLRGDGRFPRQLSAGGNLLSEVGYFLKVLIQSGL